MSHLSIRVCPSGNCKDCLISYVGGCLAGRGDDDFIQLTKINASSTIKRLSNLDQGVNKSLCDESNKRWPGIMTELFGNSELEIFKINNYFNRGEKVRLINRSNSDV